MPIGVPHVAIYCRISRDMEQRGEGVATQEAWGRRYAAEHWPGLPVEVYVDNDASAASDAAPRPDYDRLRANVDAGQVLHLWTVEQSRLTRSEIGWFQLAAQLDAAGLSEVHTNREGVIRVHDEVAGFKAIINAGEVRRLRRRVRDKLTEAALQGRPPGGSRFGYRAARMDDGTPTLEVVEEEAAEIRTMAANVLAGWGLAAVARDLKERGVATRRGGTWNEATVRQTLTNATVAGLRTHRDDIVADGNWPAILDQETWRLVRHTLDTRATARGQDGREWPVTHRPRGLPTRRWLLTGGVAVCGLCGHALTCYLRKPGGHKHTRSMYVCPTPLRGGCARIGIMAEAFEAHVADALLDYLDRPEFAEAMAADEHDARRAELTTALAGVDARKAELGRLWAAQVVDTVGWQAALEELEAERRRLLVELGGLAPAAARVDPATLRAAWSKMLLQERREVALLYIDRVVVHPHPRPGSRWAPERIEVRWKVDPQGQA